MIIRNFKKEKDDMKKIYFAPETKTVKIHTQSIIAASLGQLAESGGSIDIPEGDAEAGADAMSRRSGGMWED